MFFQTMKGPQNIHIPLKQTIVMTLWTYVKNLLSFLSDDSCCAIIVIHIGTCQVSDWVVAQRGAASNPKCSNIFLM